MRRGAQLALAAALGLGVIGAAQAADYKAEYKISTVIGQPFPWGESAVKWADLVRERTNGRINMKMYPGAQLVAGDQTKEFTAIRQGIIDMAVGSTINWSPQIPELNLFSLPFLMPDHKSIDALTQGPVGKKLFEVIASKDVVPLAWGENGFRELSNSKQPVRTPADMKGLKIRVVGSPLFLDTFTALGANPTQMSWADAQPAFATKAVDGQENPVSIFVAAKLPNVGQNNLTLWGYMADPLIFVVNKRVWESFSPEDQKIVREAAIEAGKFGIDMGRKGISGNDMSVIDGIKASGVEVVTLTPEQRKQFVDATRDVYTKWKPRIGPELVDMAEKSIKGN
ncbi:DctP family TRAP transporter solute-binding subunit [Oceanibaculum pacificum]|uniref:C4-dicarboxylate ABC transporter n=1 Tax=Oceanibaculum pacificum TaxID=580166 RepID=A0A154WGR8_9PROT|nr:DctP family TRAP transporter solute-binding subunit [Oceanibaculum pacificum]KZD12689.1 C4-dicarboxylate ABC transporter [Oceanibaculum pacificum]